MFPNFGSQRRIKRKRRLNPVPREVDAIHDLYPVLCNCLFLSSVERHGQATSVFRANGGPQTRSEHVPKTRPNRVALILRIPKTSRSSAERIRSGIAEKESTRHRQVRRPHHVAIADESPDVADMRNFYLSLRPIIAGVAICERK